MADREKVLKGLECCASMNGSACKECPYSYECVAGETEYQTGTAHLAADALALLKEQPKWISVKDRMPVELHSIFWPFYGKNQWSNAMWREQSDKVLVTVVFKDGTRLVTTGETHDGVWHTAISRTLDPIVTHWMQFPELPKEDKHET